MKLLRAALAVGLLTAVGAAEPVDLRLRFEPGAHWAFTETWEGTGELVRHRPAGEQKLKLEVKAGGERRWQVESVDTDRARLRVESRSGHARLLLVEPNREYRRERPWRGFTLVAGERGSLSELTPLDEPDSVAPNDEDLPVDLDLGELFALLELGLLPPRALAPGDRWQFPEPARPANGPAPAAAAAPMPAAPTAKTPPLKVDGRLSRYDATEQQARATLDTTVALQAPPRATPLKLVRALGSLRTSAQVDFDARAGRVDEASGPLELSLRYERTGGLLLAEVRLTLQLRATRVKV